MNTDTPAPEHLSLDDLRRMDPVEFLDAGHLPGDIFPDDHLGFLAEKAITERLVGTPRAQERHRGIAVDLLRRALNDPALNDPARSANVEHIAMRRWHAAIATDDTFAERFAETLPAETRAEAEAATDRWLHRVTFTPGVAGADDRCRCCGEMIVGPLVYIADRVDPDEEDPGNVCALCIIDAAEQVGGFGMGVANPGS